ncbi:hypothetical protein Tco_0381310 [Tanacetum coccineum]
MIYLVVLADAAESVRDTIGFEYCLASSSGWTKSPVLWAEIGESSLTGPELVLDMTDKVVLIKEKLKAARDRQKSYADNRRKPLEFEVGDRVMLKVSPWKGVIRFGKKGKLAPRYVGPFEILERVGPVAYRLRLPEELSGIKVDKTLRFVEEPVENSDREVKRLKCSRMVVVKVHLGSKRVMLLCVRFYGQAKWLAVRYLVKVSWNSNGNFELIWSNTTAKLPILKLGEYEMWVIRIKQYFQVQDYALWEVIENGNSWVSVPQTAQENGTSVTKMSVPVTAKEKTNKKNNVKARSLLLMALPNEHQLTFS